MGRGHSYQKGTVWFYSHFIDLLLRPVRAGVVQVCEEIRPENVLDICSGTGAQCLLLDRAGINTVGLDLSEAMVKSARRCSPPNVRYVRGSAFALPFDDQAFACVLLILALHEHTHAEQLTMLSEAYRVLRKEGTLILAEYSPPEHGSDRLVWSFITMIERLAGGDHYRNFRAFVEAGGAESLKGNLPLSVLARYPLFSGTISLLAFRFNYTVDLHS